MAFILAGAAIILRMASDWIFPRGGPLTYKIIQAFLLLLAIILIRQPLELIFLRGGRTQLAIKIGLLGIPLGLIFGFGDAWIEYGRPLWPGFSQLIIPVANNLFFPAVEELEFRGFLYSWLSRRNISPRSIILIVSILATLAHAHRFWQFDTRSIVITFAVNIWWTWIVYRTHSLWGPGSRTLHGTFLCFYLF